MESGRIVREGIRVALAGAPNAGKSSLINALARSDIAIVSDEAGTTRDVREVPLDIGGQLFILLDLAGLRETKSRAEAEGIRRAERAIGSERNRSMSPPWRSSARPIAVFIPPKATVCTKIPGIRKST